MGSGVIVYSPLLLLTSLRAALVPVFVAVMVTPGSDAPVESETMPSRRAVLCAAAGPVPRITRKSARAKTRSNFPRYMFPPFAIGGLFGFVRSIASKLTDSPYCAAVRRKRDAPYARSAGGEGDSGVGVNDVETGRGDGERSAVGGDGADVVHDEDALVAGVADEGEHLCIAVERRKVAFQQRLVVLPRPDPVAVVRQERLRIARFRRHVL